MNVNKQIEEIARYCCNSCEFGNQIDIENNIYPCAIDNEYKTCPLALETAESIYNAGYRKQEWISVEDRLPEEDVRVLVYLKSERSYTEIDTDRMTYGKWIRWGNDVTHWMPLPEAPKGDKTDA